MSPPANANSLCARLLIFPSAASRKFSNVVPPLPRHFGLAPCVLNVSFACWYNNFLFGATSDGYSAWSCSIYLEIYFDSVLFDAAAAFCANPLISLVNSASDLLLFPELGIIDQFGSLLFEEALNPVFAIFSTPDIEIPISVPLFLLADGYKTNRFDPFIKHSNYPKTFRKTYVPLPQTQDASAKI